MKISPVSISFYSLVLWLAACTPVQTQTPDPQVSPSPQASSLSLQSTPNTSLTSEKPLKPKSTSLLTPDINNLPTHPIQSQQNPKKRKPKYSSINTHKRVIAMTFDDGPHATFTPKLLDLLKERNIKATFFVVGRNVEQYPDIMRRIVAEGHEVASHTWSHPALTKLSAAKVGWEVSKTTDAIKKATGITPTAIRPPYGAINSHLVQRLNNEFGLTVVLWSVDPLDWKRPGVSVVAKRIIDGAHPGAIILSHDIHASTIEAMPQALDALKAAGYEFVTVSELLAMDEPAASPTPSTKPASLPFVTPSPSPTPTPNPQATPIVIFPR